MNLGNIFLSIIIVTKDRDKELMECLDSLYKSIKNTNFTFEVLIVFNGFCSYRQKIESLYPITSVNLNVSKNPGNARNLAIESVRGKYILFVDDDCVFHENYFQKIRFDQDWDVLGGPDQAAENGNAFQKMMGEVLSSPLCMGPTTSRHRIDGNYMKNATEKNIILCNLIFKSDIFTRENLRFNNELLRNEENYLISELSRKGKIVHFNPEMFIYHQRRRNLKGLMGSLRKSGECRMQMFFLRPQINELIYFLPIIWIFLHGALALVNLRWPFMLQAIYFLLILLYFLFKKKLVGIKTYCLHQIVVWNYAYGLLKGICNHMNFSRNNSFIRESRIR